MTLTSAIQKDYKFKLLLVGVVFSLLIELSAIMGYSLPKMVILPLALFLILTLGRTVLLKGFKALKDLNFKSINFLMTLAAIGAMALGEYEEAAVVIVLFALAERLEEFGFESSKDSLKTLLAKTPKMAIVKNQEVPVAVEALNVGQILIIKPGEIIPVDGVVVVGVSAIDEASITGEPIPKEKEVNDLVYAGTLNQSGYLEIKVLKKLSESTITKIVEITLSANKDKAQVHQFIEKFARIYTPFILLSAILLVLVPTFVFGQDFTKWFKEALSLLVISCPCALVISTPLSIYSALAVASAQGLLIKGGRHLEMAGQIKAVALDKTRTITLGQPRVAQIIPFKNFSVQEVLECAAGIEAMSEHPLAKSIVKEAQKKSLFAHTFKNFASKPGQGIQAFCEVCVDSHIYAGKTSYVQKVSSLSMAVQQKIAGSEELGFTSVVIADQNGEKGLILLSDEIKTESKKAIQDLQKMNVHVTMLTGDNNHSAAKIANEVGIKDVQTNLMPEDKLTAIQNLKKQYGQVAMVGDGVNDAPALAAASLGISMGAVGSDAAIEASSVAILNDNLALVPFVIQLGQKTLGTIKFNTTIAVLVKLAFLGLALAGRSELVLAIIADVGLTLFVVLNSLRLMKFQPSVA